MKNRNHLAPDGWRSNRHGLPPGMSPAERIAVRVRHRVKESERRQLRESVEHVASLADEIDALKAKAAEDEHAAKYEALLDFERDLERKNAVHPRQPPEMSEATRAAILKLAD